MTVLRVLLLLGATAGLAAWTWRRWCDLYVDFGREVYVAWRIAAGDRLYEKIATFNGPLSAHWNGLLFRLFGVEITTLVWANLLLALVGALLVSALVRRPFGALAATIASLLFLAAFAFAHLVQTGNYNFVTPYSHEATHGLLLALATLLLFRRWSRTPTPAAAALWGGALGLVFLTKTEVFVSAAASLTLGIVLLARAERAGRVERLSSLRFAAIAFAGPILLAGVLLGGKSLVTPWAVLARSHPLADPFYRRGLGLDRPIEHLFQTALWVVAIGLGAAGGFVADGWARNEGGRRQRAEERTDGRSDGKALPFVAAALFWFASFAAWRATGEALWYGIGRVLPLAAAGATAGYATAAWRARGRDEVRAESATLAAFALFALALLGKMILFSRIWHYGFYLAAPATVLLVALLIDVLPRRAGGGGRRGPASLAFGLVVCGALAASCLARTNAWRTARMVSVGSGGDAMRYYPGIQGDGGRAMLETLHALSPEEGTLAVFPEGAMLNYLTRRKNPSPYFISMPPEMAFFDEEKMLAALAASPPDLIAFLPVDLSEWGFQRFGEPACGERIAAWIRLHYDDVPWDANRRARAEWLSRNGFQILAKRSGPATGG